MGNEIVKYNNDFNNQALRNFSSEELNLLVTFFHKLKEKGTDVLEYSFYELKKLIMLEKNMTVKEFYRRMKQFRKTGFWRCSIDEFRYLMDIPENYKITNIDTRVLKPIMRELGEKYNLKIEKKYGFSGGRGRSRVTGFEFKFSTEKKVDIVAVTEKEDNNNSIPLSKPRKPKKKKETRVVSERKTRIVEAPPKIEKEKTLREKIWDKINENTETIENLEAIYTGLKDKIQFRKLTEKYPQKIEEIKNMNMQLKAIYNIDENDFTQEIIKLAEDLIIKK
jgi:hypothetical protein